MSETGKTDPIADFRAWLARKGLAPGTVDIYADDIAGALERGGPIVRLTDAALSPKTRHRMLAAARHWAKFTDDTELGKDLDEIRLPPAKRKGAKVPITMASRHEVIDEIDRADYLSEPMRAALGILAGRGLRCSDVLRIERTEVVNALATGVLACEGKGRKRVEYPLLSTFRRYVEKLATEPVGWDHVEDLLSPRSKPGAARREAASRAIERALAKVATKLDVADLHPHRLRRTYAVEFLRGLRGDPDALVKLQQHMHWESITTAMEYIDHARGQEIDDAAERIFRR